MSTSFRCKIFLVVWGFVVVAAVWHSHFESTWVTEKTYKLCTSVRHCPSIYLEYIYLAAAILTLVGSLTILLVSKWRQKEVNQVICIDIGYHVVAALVILAGSVCYLVSVVQIDKLGLAFNTTETRKELRRREKIIAGVTGLYQCMAYGVTAIILYRKIRSSSNKHLDWVIHNPVSVLRVSNKEELNYPADTNMAYKRF